MATPSPLAEREAIAYGLLAAYLGQLAGEPGLVEIELQHLRNLSPDAGAAAESFEVDRQRIDAEQDWWTWLEPTFYTRATAVRERAGELLPELRAMRDRILQAGGDAERCRTGIREIARETWTLRAGPGQ